MKSQVLAKILSNIIDYPDNNSLYIDSRYYSYKELFNLASSLARLFINVSRINSFCAILSDKNIFTYQAILGALFANKAYVPFNPKMPMEKMIKIINDYPIEILCLDMDNELARHLLENIPEVFVCIYRKNLYDYLMLNVPRHKYLYWSMDCYIPLELNEINVYDHNYAYLMFTSGSTGQPKAIAIKHSNLSQYINSVYELYRPGTQDRFSQFNELSFDLSVHEIFLCWFAGATLYVVPDCYIFGIKRFLNKHKISHFLSVPSNITLLSQLKQMSRNCLPFLKESSFCGEALLQSQALQWQTFAPNTKITNLYGPTESTVAITHFSWQPNKVNLKVVPIGIPLPNQEFILLNKKGEKCNKGEVGELYLSGSQLIESYWSHSEALHKSFCKLKDDKWWYRTGDLAKWHNQFGLLYQGRVDDQWKIHGYRVEKLEIENELRTIAHNDSIAVVPLFNNDKKIESLVAFVVEEIDPKSLLKAARNHLPDFMVPKKWFSLKSMPKNPNGKIDYPHLKKYLCENLI